jgi:hypothetical protein
MHIETVEILKMSEKRRQINNTSIIDEDGQPYLQDIFHIFLITHTWNHLHNHLMWL